MENYISEKMLAKMQSTFTASEKNVALMNAASGLGVYKASINPEENRKMRYEYSVSLKQGKITDQKQSGRCWMFAAMNTMRFQVMQKLNLETFELSQNYILFYDKLEKSNFFLENILKTLDEPLPGRLMAFLLSAPLGDGGQWDMLCCLVEKYGVVPKEAMPETVDSSATRFLDEYMTKKLREFACVLRTAYGEGKDVAALRLMKDDMMQTVYNILCISLGVPPTTFDLEVRDKDNQFIRDKGLTGKSFFAKYVGQNLSDYVSLINAPTADKPFGRTYTVKFLGNVEEGRKVLYLNLPVEELKKAAIKQLKDGEPVWFGSDVGQWLQRDAGIMSLNGVRADKLLGTTFGMNKAQRLDYGESLMTHAMVLQGVNLDDDDKADRWRVENSWGKDIGNEGYFVMSDDWFSEFTYQVVVHKKYLSEEIKAMLTQKPIELEPWDPMGSLAL